MTSLFSYPHFDSPLELKFIAETGVFEGYASVFDMTDAVHDRIAPGAFSKSLQEFRTEHRLPPLLWQHDIREPLGAWRDMHEDNHGLFVKGELFINDIPRAKEAWKLLRENVVTGLSIGYRTRESHFDEKSGVRILTDIALLEVSMVTFPANDAARILRVKSAFAAGGVPTEREFEAFLREAGLSRKQAKGLLSFGYKSLLPREAAASGDDDDLHAITALTETLRRLAGN